MQRDVYLFFGPPGAGKGSLSSLCAHRLGWRQCSTGNLCRQHIRANTALGKQIDFSIKSGKLIADSLIVEIVHDWLAYYLSDYNSVILDGFPRTVMQAQMFNELLRRQELGHFRLILVELVIDDATVVHRLTKRIVCDNKDCQTIYAQKDACLAPRQQGICDKCACSLVKRADDDESIVKNRLVVYHQHAQELLSYYQREKAHIIKVKADDSLEQVFSTFSNLIGLREA
jgi:adenylate kinase